MKNPKQRKETRRKKIKDKDRETTQLQDKDPKKKTSAFDPVQVWENILFLRVGERKSWYGQRQKEDIGGFRVVNER